MEPSELAFFTTDELIRELMSRKTFLGVVVRAENEERGEAWEGERTFRVHFNENLSAAEAGRLLDAVAPHIADCDR